MISQARPPRSAQGKFPVSLIFSLATQSAPQNPTSASFTPNRQETTLTTQYYVHPHFHPSINEALRHGNHEHLTPALLFLGKSTACLCWVIRQCRFATSMKTLTNPRLAAKDRFTRISNTQGASESHPPIASWLQ
jgi:hypothetical protein